MVDLTELSELCGGFISPPLGFAYGIRESQMHKHNLNDMYNDTIWYRLLTDTDDTEPIGIGKRYHKAENLKNVKSVKQVNEEKGWILLNSDTGSTEAITLDIELVDNLLPKTLVYIAYNGSKYRLRSKTIRDITFVLGKPEIPIKYWNKL